MASVDTVVSGSLWRSTWSLVDHFLAAGKGQEMTSDRARLSSTQLYQLATQDKITLSQAEKDRVTADYLFVLAITNKLKLNEHDKGRLRPLHIARLAMIVATTGQKLGRKGRRFNSAKRHDAQRVAKMKR
jgi:hypothetical protein